MISRIRALHLAAQASIVMGLVLPIIAAKLPPASAQNLLFISRMAWLLAPVCWPSYWLLSGEIRSRSGVSIRSKEPNRYWTGVIALTLMLLILSAIMQIGLRVTH